MDPIEENNRLNILGKFEVRTMSSSKNPDKANSGEMLPFGVGIYRFADNNGLYCIVGFDGEPERLLFEKLLHALSYSGIGGKRSSGLGSFSFVSNALGEPIVTRLNGRNHVISLSVSMAAPEELDLALTGARYTLIKRSGFVYSDSYADSPRRKKDFYSFKAGSYFLNGFDGGIFDVSGGGTHPVYRYAIPLFMEV
ncbi:MAG: hypothetical protein GX488_01210 [Clostridiales bacterium]|nr:hypothetical protein [Clostridiales bacterium]